jgi:elongation factor P
MLDFSEIKMGKVIEYKGQPCVIIKCDFMRMQASKPTKKCMLKNLVSGSNLEYTFKSGEKVDEADLRKDKATFLYQTGSQYSFMHSDTYETVNIGEDLLEGSSLYLKEGLEVHLVYFNDEVIAVDLPLKVVYTITYTEDAAKGNTVNNVLKDATLETGKVIKVPAFIKIDDTIRVNTQTDEYVERA